MKKFLVCILALILLTSTLLVSCKDDPVTPPASSPSDDKQTDGNGEQPPVVTEQSIKAAVINLFNTDSEYQNPNEIFEHFLGDYSLNVKSGADIRRVWQKDGVTVMEYNDGHSEYSLTRNGYVFKLSSASGQPEVVSAEPLSTGIEPIPSIFDDFGISLVTTVYTEKNPTVETLVLTEDMISVSEDLSSATLSDSFVRSFANVLLDGLEYTDAEKETFFSDYTASGKYSVREDKLTIILNGNLKETGKTVITTVVESQSKGYSITETMEYVTKIGDADVPTKMEITVSDRAYNDAKEVVRASLVSKITIEDAPTVINDLTYPVSTTVTTSISLDAENKNVNARVTQVSSAKIGEQTSTGNLTTVIEVYGGNFTYVSALNGASNGQLYGKDVTFGTPDGAQIPQAVYQKVEEKYNSLSR